MVLMGAVRRLSRLCYCLIAGCEEECLSQGCVCGAGEVWRCRRWLNDAQDWSHGIRAVVSLVLGCVAKWRAS